ncbi:MAG: hypothetical protein SVU69_11635 [Pseudomonadota bacterium]|nr:hypothetical protein [Pseudomonadota bacterium]
MSEPIDYEKALLDPASVFETPEDVLEQLSLTQEQKIEILRRWEYAASEIAVAEEEGMVDGKPLIVRQVLLALDSLTGGIDVEHTSPTKQNGV